MGLGGALGLLRAASGESIASKGRPDGQGSSPYLQSEQLCYSPISIMGCLLAFLFFFFWQNGLNAWEKFWRTFIVLSSWNPLGVDLCSMWHNSGPFQTGAQSGLRGRMLSLSWLGPGVQRTGGKRVQVLDLSLSLCYSLLFLFPALLHSPKTSQRKQLSLSQWRLTVLKPQPCSRGGSAPGTECNPGGNQVACFPWNNQLDNCPVSARPCRGVGSAWGRPDSPSL